MKRSGTQIRRLKIATRVKTMVVPTKGQQTGISAFIAFVTLAFLLASPDKDALLSATGHSLPRVYQFRTEIKQCTHLKCRRALSSREAKRKDKHGRRV